MVGHDEAARVVAGPVRGVQGRGDRSLPPTRECRRRGDARERIRDEDNADGDSNRGSESSTHRRQVQEAEEPDPRQDRERYDEVLHVSIGNEDSGCEDDAYDGGAEEDDEPGVDGQSIRVEIEKLPAGRGKRNQEDEWDEVEEAVGRNSERGARDIEENGNDAEDQDRPDRGGVRGPSMAKPRIPRPVSPCDSGPCVDNRRKQKESQPEQDEECPPGPNVHIREDEFTEGRRVNEPVGERPREEDARIGDFPLRPGRPPPRASETSHEDRADDHEEEEVEGQVMRRDQSPRHEDERDDGRPIGPKSKKEEKPREGEQISEGRGCRMGSSVRVGDGADQESRGEEATRSSPEARRAMRNIGSTDNAPKISTRRVST